MGKLFDHLRAERVPLGGVVEDDVDYVTVPSSLRTRPQPVLRSPGSVLINKVPPSISTTTRMQQADQHVDAVIRRYPPAVRRP